MKKQATISDIKQLNKLLEYDELTNMFVWDIEHWIEKMKFMNIDQYKRFLALSFVWVDPEKSREVKDKAFAQLVEFLEQFNIRRILK